MPRIFVLILQVSFLALLYLFVARAVRAVLLDVYGPRPGRAAVRARRARRAAGPAPRPRRAGGERPGRPGRRAPRQLLVTDLDGKRTVPLGDVLTVGRAASCDLVVADNYVSNVHARISARDGGYWLEDLGSTNGTFLNEERVSEAIPVPVGVGDTVRVGKATLELRR
jgi:pSer/pThr/pTyr-binding forkhead associated (FHA) protein